MKSFSYYCAAIVYQHKWYAYLPDFNVTLQVGDTFDNVRDTVYEYIFAALDRHFNAENYAEKDRLDTLPVAMSLYAVIFNTKQYLRRHELSIDNYIENMEIIVNYDQKSHRVSKDTQRSGTE